MPDEHFDSQPPLVIRDRQSLCRRFPYTDLRCACCELVPDECRCADLPLTAPLHGTWEWRS